MLRPATRSTTERPLALRMRSDLVCVPQIIAGERLWAIKDPVTLKYCHLREEEYELLQHLDGQASLEELCGNLEQTFAPRRFNQRQLHGFLSVLHRSGLVVSEAAGQGGPLLDRHDEDLRRRTRQSALGLLAIRFRGINPRPLLNWLAPKCEWLFSTPLLVAGVLLMLAAATLVSVEFDAFTARLPEVRTILSASNLPWLALALCVTKLLHELGHALACRRFGADCHELGLMLLVFTPTLYCNVTDSWMLASKWQRMAIAAAGIYVELLLAAAATFLWWFSQPGLFNSLCLNVMILCTVGTVVLNGNPLMRYDGYYLLSDFVEVPNLAAQASFTLRRLLARWCLGIDLPADRPQSFRRQALLAGYAVLSLMYRLFVLVAIFWGLRAIARQHDLEVLLLPLVAVTVVGLAAPLVTGIFRWSRQATVRRRIAPARALVTFILLTALAGFVLFVPLHVSVSAPLVLEYREARNVYVTSPGRLEWYLPYGTAVQQNDPLARLVNSDVALGIAQLTTDRNRQARHVANLESQQLQGTIDGGQLPAARAGLDDVQRRLGQLEHEAARLTLVAPIDGTTLAPPNQLRALDADRLPRWSGVPLDEPNLGCFLESGDLVCLVGDPTKVEALLSIDESDVELVAPGQSVRLMFDNLPGKVFTGRLVDVARLDLKTMPRELAAAGDIPLRTDSRGANRPLTTWYQARVELDATGTDLLARVHGRAKIEVQSQSLAQRLARFVRQTFSR